MKTHTNPDGTTVSIPDSAYIGNGAHLAAGAIIGESAYILTMCAKYMGHIVPYADRVDIRIGCGQHSLEYWQEHGDEGAHRYGETAWWDSTGKRMLAFLAVEAEQYAEKYLKKESEAK